MKKHWEVCQKTEAVHAIIFLFFNFLTMCWKTLTFFLLLFLSVIYGKSLNEEENVIIEDFNITSTTSRLSTVAPGINLQPLLGQDSGSESDNNCTCIPYYLCNNGKINKNGKGIIDVRINVNPCGVNYLDQCCTLEDTRSVQIPFSPKSPPLGCGYRNPDGVGFSITGDTDDSKAQFGEFPWMVAILQEKQSSNDAMKLNVFQCGGALIHPQAVLTAAHCVIDKTKVFRIRAGEWDSQHEAEPFPHQDREVQSITVHPEFYSGALYNDVAVLILKSPVKVEQNVGTVCLPPQDFKFESERCFATGWGKNVFGRKGKYQVILKKIDLPVVQNPECQTKLRSTRLGKFFELHSSFICAGGEANKDTCKGDGGGPLVCPIAGAEDRYYQAGIVAWGIGCGEDQTPGVYVNVARFRNWIDEQIVLAGLDTSCYQY